MLSDTERQLLDNFRVHMGRIRNADSVEDRCAFAKLYLDYIILNRDVVFGGKLRRIAAAGITIIKNNPCIKEYIEFDEERYIQMLTPRSG